MGTTSLSDKQESGYRGALAPLPCLYSNISNERVNSGGFAGAKLSTQQRKSSFILQSSISSLAERFGLPYMGFLTLTFADHVLCPKEAQKRLNSLLTGVIKQRYREYVGVMERQKSGRIHYHLLVVLTDDIRAGFNFDQVKLGVYKSANPFLRREWAFWRVTAKKYGFGRTELMPIRSTIEAISKYVGKYIAKHIEVRKEEDKGVRLVRYSRGARIGTTRFMFQSNGSEEWRKKLGVFSEIVERVHGVEINDISDFKKVLGNKWAFHNRDFILDLPV